jgi:hypothetical protein
MIRFKMRRIKRPEELRGVCVLSHVMLSRLAAKHLYHGERDSSVAACAPSE